MAISVSDLVSTSGAKDITAVETAAPAPTQAPPPGFLQEPMLPKDESKIQIPDAVLQLPTFRPLLQGQPPALLITQAEFDQDPEAQTIQANMESLIFSGFGAYRTKDGNSAVLFNGQYIDGAAIKLADDKGQLEKVVTPYSELKTFFAENLGEAAVEGAVSAPAPTAQPMGAPAPASSQTQLANARIANLAPGSPTSGPAPGQGRVLNNILKSTV